MDNSTQKSCVSSATKGTCHKETGAKCALNGVFRPSVVFDYDRHKAVKHMILSNDSGRIIILVVPEGHEVASHSVNADVMVQVLEGEMRFTLEGREYAMHGGDAIRMSPGQRHSLYAVTDFKAVVTQLLCPEEAAD